MKNCLQNDAWVPQVSSAAAERPGIRTSYAVALRLALAAVCLLSPSLLLSQATDAMSAQANQQKAHAVLAATIQALGGQAWRDVRTMRAKIHAAKFSLGSPDGTFSAIGTSEAPDKERLDVPKQHVVQIFFGGNGWEITYKGKRKLSQQEMDEYFRLKNHSLDTVLNHWYNNPATVLMDEGPSQIDTHRTEKITLINAANDAVTLEIDTESHLPLNLSYSWRDSQFHDKNVDFIEYDNYHRIDGIATPFTVTHTHNGEVVREVYMLSIKYNVDVDEKLFDPDYAAAHLK
jgi:hypothetical protein